MLRTAPVLSGRAPGGLALRPLAPDGKPRRTSGGWRGPEAGGRTAPLRRLDLPPARLYAAIGRLLLLLLLVCDWAADPSLGTSPLSAPLASTESFCHSLAHREAVRQGCRPAPQGGPGGLPPHPHAEVPPPPHAQMAQEPPTPAPASSLVYVFMSLRR
jgi:hypothetical protein